MVAYFEEIDDIRMLHLRHTFEHEVKLFDLISIFGICRKNLLQLDYHILHVNNVISCD